MVSCIKCTKQIHSRSSCATILDANKMQYICSMCKITQRRCNQASTTPGTRHSASQVVTPPSTILSQVSRRVLGRNSHKNSIASSTVQPASDVLLLKIYK